MALHIQFESHGFGGFSCFDCLTSAGAWTGLRSTKPQVPMTRLPQAICTLRCLAEPANCLAVPAKSFLAFGCTGEHFDPRVRSPRIAQSTFADLNACQQLADYLIKKCLPWRVSQRGPTQLAGKTTNHWCLRPANLKWMPPRWRMPCRHQGLKKIILMLSSNV